MKPLLSIICTVYNHEKYIEQTLNGFSIQQTDFPIEIIIHDDASTDKSQKIIKKYAKTDSRVRLILQTENQYSQNKKPWATFCFPKAKGRYIALCEGDDYWVDPLKLQKQVHFLENHMDYGSCFHDVMVYNQEQKKIEEDKVTNNKKEIYNISDLVKGNFIHTPTMVMRNDFTLPKEYNQLPIGDWPLYVLQNKDRKIKRFSNKMAVYRIHKEGVWSTKTKLFRHEATLKIFHFLEKHAALPKEALKNLKKNKNKIQKRLTKHKFLNFFNLSNFEDTD